MDLKTKPITVTNKELDVGNIPSYNLFPQQDPQQLLYGLYKDLRILQEQGDINPEGEKMLSMIEDGAITPAYVGSFLKGASLNWSDEVAGMLNAAFGDTPKQIKEQADLPLTETQIATGLERIKQKEFGEANPVVDPLMQIAGGVTTDILASKGYGAYKKAKGIPTVAKSVLQKLGEGTKYGLAAGLGESEASGEGAGIKTVGTTLAGGALGAGGVGLASGLGVAYQKGAKPLIKSMFTTQNSQAKKQAQDLVKTIIEYDVKDLDEAAKIVFERQGKQYQIGDLGTNSRKMVDWAMNIPNPSLEKSKKFLEQRTNGMPVRLTSDLGDQFGTKMNFYDTFNAHKVARADKGQKYYKEAFGSDIPVTDDLLKILKRPSVQDSFDYANKLAAEEGIDIGKLAISKGKLTLNGKPVESINTEYMHYVKMSLDDIIGTKGKSPESSIGRTLLGKYAKTKNELLDYIDTKNPNYKYARDQWAGDTAVMNAMDTGRQIFTKEFTDNPQLVRDLVKTMSNSEKEAFRNGVMNAVLDSIGGAADEGLQAVANRNIPRTLLSDRKKLAIIRETFNSEQQYNKFINNLKDEMQMFETGKVGTGSMTQPRQEIDKMIGRDAFRDTRDMQFGNIALNIVNKVLGGASEQEKQVLAQNILDITLNQTPEEMAKTFARLKGASTIEQLERILERTLGRPFRSQYAIGQQGGVIGEDLTVGRKGLLNYE